MILNYALCFEYYACVILTDTEGSFMVERAKQIAEASVYDMSAYNDLLRKENCACQIKLEPNDILQDIYYFRICSYTEQMALINYLDKFISEHKDVGIGHPYSLLYALV